MGWLFKTIAGAAITAIVGFFVTKYLEQSNKSGSDRHRVERGQQRGHDGPRR